MLTHYGYVLLLLAGLTIGISAIVWMCLQDKKNRHNKRAEKDQGS